MRIINYSLGNRYNKFGKIESVQIILARPGKRALGVLNGVREDTCNLEMNLNNTWVLSFNVDRVVNGSISNYYNCIEQKMELHLPGYGWFKITEEPVMSNDGNTESLSIHAESLEIEFQQYILKGFECNTGTTASLEYLATDNMFYYDNDKSYPFFRENVRFYRDTTAWEEMMDAFEQTDKSEQALLGLISQHPCIMDSWRINYDLSDFDHAIDTVVTLGEQAGRNMNVLKSYSGQFAKFAMEGLDQQAQQTAFSLTRIWPELLNYITAINIDRKCYDETHDGDYTLDEIVHLELQRQKDLSLLDVVANHYGWHVGFVDDSVVADSDVDDDRIPLSQKTGMFEIDSQNAYTFMTQEMASYFRCVFIFDTYAKTVNAYNINNLGVDTNIFLSFHNIQNSVERSGNDTIHTAFYIQGGDELDPLEANFGENEIWDLSYYMNTQHFSQSTIDKYNAWIEYHESQRQSYMDYSVEFKKQFEVVNELNDRVPIDAADTTQYSTMSDDELTQEKEKQLALLRGIESRYVDDNDEFDIDALQQNDPEIYQEYLIIRDSLLSNPTDALRYLEYDSENDEYVFIRDGVDTSDYRLGNIDICIFNRMLLDGSFIDVGDDADTIKSKTNYTHQKEYLEDYLYDFDIYGDVYGVTELQNHLQDLENRYTTLWNKGYGVDDEDDPNHHTQYELYLKYKNSYDKCKAVLDVRQQEYDDASDELNNISQQMLDIKTDVAIENEQFGFTDEELELIKKYLYYTDYTNENMIITSISTPEEIVETEYQLIKDAQEELYAAAHPQWIWTTSQDNLFLIAENDDWYGTIPHPSYKDWRDNLVIGNFLHVGFREDDHLPDYVYVDSSSNQVKLRLISVGLNPFMIEPTIDLTFSTMIQYKSRRNDFVDLLGLASGVGDHQITATFQSKKLDDTFQIDSSFVMKLLNNGAFANYAAGSIMNTGALDTFVVPIIHAAEINVGKITGTTGQFQEMFVNYLDADTIATRIISADNANFKNLIAGTINATTGGIIQLSSTNATIDAGYVTNLVAGRLSVAQLAAGDLTLSNSMRIKSDNGYLAMNGSVLQIGAHQDQNGNMIPQIQLGYGTNNEPSLVFRDQNGTSGILIGYTDNTGKPSIAIYDTEGNIMINSGGIAEAENRVIADELIVNDMVKQGTLGKERMNFNVMEAGDDIIIEQLTYTDGTKFGTEYTTFEQDITNAVAEFVDVIPSVELTGAQTFTVDEDSNILPSKITIYANPRNGFIPYTWTIDGVDASQYVASDGLSIDVPNTAMTNVASAVVRCQNEDGSSYDAITLSKLPSYNSSITTVSVDNNPVQFFTSTSGVPLFRQTATSKITVYKGAEQFYNFSINNLVTPTGVTATASSNSIEITVSPTAAIGNTGVITFDVVMNGGATISKSITINRLVSTDSESTIVEYTLQTSNLKCSDSAVWTELRPTPSAEQFLWYRYRTDYSNGDPSKYSKPYYVSTITGLISMTDAINKSITNKIWQDDFSSYDEQVIRHRESEITQTVDSISTTVSETSSNLGTLTTNYQQTATEFHWLFTNTAQTGQSTSMSLTNNGLSLINGTIAVTDGQDTTTITPNSVLSNTLTSVDGQSQINLREGTFNFGDGALSWDGDTLTIGGSFKDDILRSIQDGVLTVRTFITDNVTYPVMYFDNNLSNDDPLRNNVWVNFKGHKVDVNPFVLEVNNKIHQDVTQYVVYRPGILKQLDKEYSVWFSDDDQQWYANQISAEDVDVVSMEGPKVTVDDDTTNVKISFIYSGNARGYYFTYYSDCESQGITTTGGYGVTNEEDEYSQSFNVNEQITEDTTRVFVDVNIPSIEVGEYMFYVLLQNGQNILSWNSVSITGDKIDYSIAPQINWEWQEKTDIIVAEYVRDTNNDVEYEVYYPSKTYDTIQQNIMLRNWGIDGEITETTTINGGSIDTGSITTDALSAQAIRSKTYTETGNNPIYSNSGTWINLEDSGFIRSKNFAIDSNGNAYFKGEINANSGRIGGTTGWIIDSNKIYSGTADGGTSDGDVTLSTSNFSRSINGTSRTGLRFAIGSNFGVANDGTVYANNANVTGTIAANDGKIGGANGWVITTNKIYSGTVDSGTASGDVTLSTADFSRDINSVSRTGLRFAIGSNFGVTNSGTLYAANADISGSITATSLNVSNATITGTISGDKISGGTISGTSFSQTGTSSFSYTSADGNMSTAGFNCAATISNGVVSTTVIDTSILVTSEPSKQKTLDCLSNFNIYGNLTVSTDVWLTHAIYNNMTSASYLRIDDNSLVGCSGSSSKRYKDVQSILTSDEIESLYDIPVYNFKYKDGYLVESDERRGSVIPGFIVEDWEEIMPIAVDHLNDGRPEVWNSNIVVPLMFQMIKNEHERNDKLREEINELKTMIKQLSER